MYCTNQLVCAVNEEATKVEMKSDPNEASSMLNNIWQNFKQHPGKFTRLTLNNIVAGLNRLSAFIKIKEETEPGKRSLWSKIKAKVAHMITAITHWIAEKLNPKDEDKLQGHAYTSSLSADAASRMVDGFKSAYAKMMKKDPELMKKYSKRIRTVGLAGIRGVLEPNSEEKYRKYSRQ